MDVDLGLPARRRALLRRGLLARWRPVGEFAAARDDDPAKTALHVDEQRISYDELRRAAIALSARLATADVRRGDVVLLLGRNSIEAAVALLACFHLGAVAAPLPPMFGRAQLAELAAQAGAKALIAFGGEAEIEKCRGLRGQLELVLRARARRHRRSDRREVADADRDRRRRGRARAAPALLRDDIGAQGDHALGQHAAVRDRADPRALGADRSRTRTSSSASSDSSAASCSVTW